MQKRKFDIGVSCALAQSRAAAVNRYAAEDHHVDWVHLVYIDVPADRGGYVPLCRTLGRLDQTGRVKKIEGLRRSQARNGHIDQFSLSKGTNPNG